MSNKVIFGTAKEIITPAERTTLIGFGSVFAIPFNDIHDDLYVRTLTLQDESGEKVILMAFDLLFHDDSLVEALRDYANEKYGVPKDNLHLAYTHTHFGPAVKGYDFNCYKESYEQFIFDRACRTIDRAYLSQYTGYIKYSKVEGEWNMSRRLMENGVMNFKPNPDGEVDKNLYLLKIEDEKGNMRALAMNFACHPSNLLDSYHTISSEYPGRLCQRVEGEFYGCTALFFQGFGSDAKLRKGAKSTRFQQITNDECDEVACAMTQRIKAKLLTGDWQTLPIKLGGKAFKLQLPLEPYSKEKYIEIRDMHVSRKNEMMVKNCDLVINNYETWPDEMTLSCGAVQLNPDFYIFSMGGEPGINIATVLRESMPDKQILCFGYNNAVAYVPSDKMIKEGGYEADGSVPEYRLKGAIKPGVDKIYCDGFRAAVDSINK